MKHLIVNFIILAMVCAPASIFAQEISTDRPDQTESSATVGGGNLQLESGAVLTHIGLDRQWLLPTNLFRYGVTDRFELRMLNQFESNHDQFFDKTYNGASDFELGTKIQLYQKEDAITEIAFMSHVGFPTGSKFITSNEYYSINKILISHAINENTELGYNLGYSNFGLGNEELNYSFALGIGVNNKVGVYIEPYGLFGTDFDLKAGEHSFDAGFTYLAQDNLQLDFSFGTGLNYEMNYISAGFSWLVIRNKE